VHFLDAIAPRLAESRIQLVMRKFRAGHNIFEQFSVMDENLRPSFNDGLQFLAFVRHQSYQEIQAYKSCR